MSEPAIRLDGNGKITKGTLWFNGAMLAAVVLGAIVVTWHVNSAIKSVELLGVITAERFSNLRESTAEKYSTLNASIGEKYESLVKRMDNLEAEIRTLSGRNTVPR